MRDFIIRSPEKADHQDRELIMRVINLQEGCLFSPTKSIMPRSQSWMEMFETPELGSEATELVILKNLENPYSPASVPLEGPLIPVRY